MFIVKERYIGIRFTNEPHMVYNESHEYCVNAVMEYLKKLTSSNSGYKFKYDYYMVKNDVWNVMVTDKTKKRLPTSLFSVITIVEDVSKTDVH